MHSFEQRLPGSETAPVHSQAAKLLLTVPEAAACLSVSRAHLYRLVQAGELRVVHSRGAVRVPYSELMRYVEHLLRNVADADVNTR